jgi:RNA polymerase sigma-70 factor, ECF subfamily
MEPKDQDLNAFRPMLFSIAYNMLGTSSDAEDMVQETFISWLNGDRSHVDNMKFYLIRTVSNKCITHLKKLKKQRAAYLGTWLPEPLLATSGADNMEVKDKLSIGFLYLLEKLTPIERGVIILKEAFDLDYLEIAAIFEITYENCRQHFSRAKKKLLLEKSKFTVDKGNHEKILRAFLHACINKDPGGLIELLREEVVVYVDGGGSANALLNPVFGKENVIQLLVSGMEKLAAFARTEIISVNGLSGAAFYQNPDDPIPTVLIAIDTTQNEKIENVYFVAYPQKIHVTKSLL